MAKWLKSNSIKSPDICLLVNRIILKKSTVLSSIWMEFMLNNTRNEDVVYDIC